MNDALDYALPFRVLAFYVLAPVAAPAAAVEAHRRFLLAREMVGRVYISAEGLNAQVRARPLSRQFPLSLSLKAVHTYRESAYAEDR